MCSSTTQIIIGYLCFDCCCLCCVSMPQIILQSEIIQSCLYKNCLTHYSHSQLMVELVCGNRATPTIYFCIYVKSTTQQCLSISLNQIYINSNSQFPKHQIHTHNHNHTHRQTHPSLKWPQRRCVLLKENLFSPDYGIPVVRSAACFAPTPLSPCPPSTFLGLLTPDSFFNFCIVEASAPPQLQHLGDGPQSINDLTFSNYLIAVHPEGHAHLHHQHSQQAPHLAHVVPRGQSESPLDASR